LLGTGTSLLLPDWKTEHFEIIMTRHRNRETTQQLQVLNTWHRLMKRRELMAIGSQSLAFSDLSLNWEQKKLEHEVKAPS
jgi:hypothetical protein